MIDQSAPSAVAKLTLPRNCTFDESDWRVLSNHWYPLAFSEEIQDKPLNRVLLDEDLIAYRTTGGEVVVAKNLCIHRGTPLSLGWQEGDELVCAYHGFRYGKNGKCTLVPAQPDLPVPKKLCLSTFLSVERYGIVWTCLSGQPAADIPDWPEAEDEKFRRLHIDPVEWNSSAGRQIENFLDVGHFSWIHVGTFGNRERPEVPLYEVEKNEHGFHAEYPYQASNPTHSVLKADSTDGTIERWMVYDLTFPFSCRLNVRYGEGQSHCIFDSAVPVSRKKVRIFFFIARNFDHHIPAEDLLNWERGILAEDKPIVENQRPEELPLDLSEEFHIRCDRMATAYRTGLKKLGLGKEFSA